MAEFNKKAQDRRDRATAMEVLMRRAREETELSQRMREQRAAAAELRKLQAESIRRLAMPTLPSDVKKKISKRYMNVDPDE